MAFSGAEQNAVALRQMGVITTDAFHQLNDPRAMISDKFDIGCFFHHGQGVCDSSRAAAGTQKCVIVFGVADDVVCGQFHIVERRGKSGGLVHAWRQYHDCALVEDNLKFKPEFSDDLKDRRLVGLPGSDDTAPD
jgi:hypothetical protein